MAVERRPRRQRNLEWARDREEGRLRDDHGDFGHEEWNVIDYGDAVMQQRTLVAVTLLLCPSIAAAQSIVPKDMLKRSTLVATTRGTCPQASVPRAPTSDQRRQARDLAERGQQAAILGDSVSARDQLRQAAQLDPTDPDLAYRLARADETSGAADDAAKEYCRFIALAPAAPEAAEAREKIASLARPALSGQAVAAEATFRAGITAYERGQMVQAEAAFNAAIKNQPSWADAYYDRALVLVQRGQRDAAIRDFEQYLRLKPEADDRVLVVARIDNLRRSTVSPMNALALGIVIPGAGQFYTGRPVRGLVSLIAAGGALAFGVQQRTRTVTVQQSATDPFGNPYTFTTTQLKTDRPNLVPGVAAAGAIAVGSAIEAYLFAHHAQDGGRRVALSVTPGGAAIAVGLTVSR
jgi:tetratricopeptide (TPR) repeat protein